MKRTASATMDRSPGGFASLSPSPGRRTINNVTSPAHLSTTRIRNNFSEEDSKSKNILAWAGRVKELIGTFDTGHDPAMGQLTRATGYSDLLAACGGVDSGDVRANQVGQKTEQTSSTKPTSPHMAYDPTKPTTPLFTKLAAEKEDQASSLARNMFPVFTRPEDSPRQAERPEIRRSFSSQAREKRDLGLPEVVQKPPARRSSQTEVKPPAVRETSRSPEARPSQGRSVAAAAGVKPKLSSSDERNVSGGQHQPRGRLATRSSKDRVSLTSPKVSSDEAEKGSNQGGRDDVGRRSLSAGAVATRRSDVEKLNERPVISNNYHRPARRQRTSDQEVNSSDENEMAQTGDRDRYPQKQEVRRPTDVERRESPSHRDPVNYRDEARRSISVEDSTDSLSQRVGDLDMRRRSEIPPSRRPQRGRATPEGSEPHKSDENEVALTGNRGRHPQKRGVRRQTEVEPMMETPSRRDPVNYRDEARRPIGESPAQRSRRDNAPRPSVGVEEKDSVESLSESDGVDPRRPAENSRPARPQPRGRPPPRRQPDTPVEEKDSLDSLSDMATGLFLQRRTEYPGPGRQKKARSPRVPESPLDSEDKTSASEESVLQVDDDRQQNEFIGHQQRGRLPAPQRVSELQADAEDKDSLESFSVSERVCNERQQRARPAPQRLPDAPPTTDSQDPSTRREQTSPVRGRKRVPDTKPEAKVATTNLVPTGRTAAKPRTTSAGPATLSPPRPILRKKSPTSGIKIPTAAVATTAAALRPEIPRYGPQQARPSSVPPVVRARPESAVPLRRTAAATTAVTAGNQDDLDPDVDYLISRIAGTRAATRSLAKSTAVTDLVDDIGGRHRTASNRRYGRTSTSPTTVSMTPRGIWAVSLPWLRNFYHLFSPLVDYIRRVMYRLVVETGHKMHEPLLRVFDDWALFGAVIFALASIFLVIMLC